jgi:hypothetical protein
LSGDDWPIPDRLTREVIRLHGFIFGHIDVDPHCVATSQLASSRPSRPVRRTYG